MVDHPALAVANDGALHVAWVRASLPDAGPPLGIHYARIDPSGSAGLERAARAGRRGLRLAPIGAGGG